MNVSGLCQASEADHVRSGIHMVAVMVTKHANKQAKESWKVIWGFVVVLFPCWIQASLSFTTGRRMRDIYHPNLPKFITSLDSSAVSFVGHYERSLVSPS